MKKNRNKNIRFEAGVSLIITTVLLISGMSMAVGINSNSSTVSDDVVAGGSTSSGLVPHPIYGYATYACGGGWAVGASVEVVSSEGTLTDTVGSGGEWMVDCGCPVPCWPDGTGFTVWINGTGGYAGWQNVSYGTVSGYSDDMGTLVLYPPVLVADAGGPYSGVVGVGIQFSGSASGGVTPYSWSWDFDDGNTSSLQNPVYAYGSTGVFTVTLTVIDSCSNVGVDTASVSVDPELQADAGGPYSGSICSAIQFTGSATGGFQPYVSWLWTFGDGNTSTLQNPSHQYTNTGNYTVMLTVTDNMAYTDDDVTYAIVIYTNPLVDANGPYNGTICEPIDFTGSATGGCTPYTWLWDFGDGDTSTQKNPSHQYTDTGTFTVTLTVTDDLGFSDDDVTYADVEHPELFADANGPYSGSIYAPIQFNGDATGGCTPYSWLWDFGDGNTSTLQNPPPYQYTVSGTYTLTLTVTDDAGYSDDDVTNATVSENHPPEITTISGPNSGKPGTSYDYTFNAVDPDGDDVRYHIDWGDDDSNITVFASSGDDVTVSHIWADERTYMITAEAEDELGEFGPEGSKIVTMPRNKAIHTSPFLNWLQSHPNMFPMLQKLIQRLGL